MTVERTLSIIKPDSVEKHKIGSIVDMIEARGLVIKAMKMVQLSRSQAQGFYAVHRERPFFGELVNFMTRSPIVVMCLESDNAILKYRELMGATDPKKANVGTIRKAYGANIQENAVHGSDAQETARFEIAYFFPGFELV
jgi:nucleoside-diphosphate kinase